MFTLGGLLGALDGAPLHPPCGEPWNSDIMIHDTTVYHDILGKVTIHDTRSTKLVYRVFMIRCHAMSDV